ncbi:MAG TPA: hypothetical protein VNI60_09245 [Pyrinomonadaceae bacterium]|nr:hypothetical protein [Pyrinomonadaceae bacterium]
MPTRQSLLVHAFSSLNIIHRTVCLYHTCTTRPHPKASRLPSRNLKEAQSVFGFQNYTLLFEILFKKRRTNY